LRDHHGLVSDDGDGLIGWIREIVLDSADPWGLARFWAGLLGGTPVEWYPGWVTLEPPPHGQRLSFQGAARLAPAWSGRRADFVACLPGSGGPPVLPRNPLTGACVRPESAMMWRLADYAASQRRWSC
jgi:hypothetical protein